MFKAQRIGIFFYIVEFVLFQLSCSDNDRVVWNWDNKGKRGLNLDGTDFNQVGFKGRTV